MSYGRVVSSSDGVYGFSVAANRTLEVGSNRVYIQRRRQKEGFGNSLNFQQATVTAKTQNLQHLTSPQLRPQTCENSIHVLATVANVSNVSHENSYYLLQYSEFSLSTSLLRGSFYENKHFLS